MQRELVEAARDGDHEAFETLASGVAVRLLAVARLILRDTFLAEDAVQDALVNAWRHLPSLRDADRFDGWMYRLVVNACGEAGRARRRVVTQIRMIPRAEPLPDASGWIADRDQLDRGFQRLNPEQRVALVLHYYVGLRVTEIADTLGLPVATVKSRIHYGTQIMRAALEADDRPVSAAGGLR